MLNENFLFGQPGLPPTIMVWVDRLYVGGESEILEWTKKERGLSPPIPYLPRFMVRSCVRLRIDSPFPDPRGRSRTTLGAVLPFVVISTRPRDLVFAVLLPLRPVDGPQACQLLVGQLHSTWAIVCEHSVLTMLDGEGEVPTHRRRVRNGRFQCNHCVRNGGFGNRFLDSPFRGCLFG